MGAFTLVTVSLSALGALLMIFCVASIMQFNNLLLGVTLLLSSSACFYIAYRDYKNIAMARVVGSIWVGKKDVKVQPLELGND